MTATANTDRAGKGAPAPEDAGCVVSPALAARLAPGEAPPRSADAVRALLVARDFCAPGAPAVTLELFGGLRMRTGCDLLPLRADTVGRALGTLRRVFPVTERLLPEDSAMGEYYRFSINGTTVTTDLTHALHEGDHVVLFSASVGG